MRSIVIIDDCADWRMLIAQLLREDHFNVLEIASLEDIPGLQQQAPLVLLNINMSKGIQILTALSTGSDNLRIVAYSSSGDSVALADAMTNGATHSILEKTTNPQEFLAQVRIHAESSGILRTAPVPARAPENNDLPPPFTLRLSSRSGETTHWLAYERITFFGEEMHVSLACRYHLPFFSGETVRIDTRLGSTQATMGRITLVGTLILLLHQNSRVASLFKSSWD